MSSTRSVTRSKPILKYINWLGTEFTLSIKDMQSGVVEEGPQLFRNVEIKSRLISGIR